MTLSFKPVIALVGRPNVGKSTLFNRLTRSRDAIVANFPGLTRDRHYGEGRIGGYPYIVIDTGGFEPVTTESVMVEMAKQTWQAVLEADAIVFLVDSRAGLTGHDRDIADKLRRLGRNVYVAVNKAEGQRSTAGSVSEFFELGLGDPFPISAAHGDGVATLFDLILSALQPASESTEDEEDAIFSLADEAEADNPREHRLRLAIVGRPNVGKSTLINTILGEERVIAFDMPGTTRDAIEIPFEKNGQSYVLIDTAGLRKRGKVFETIEKFSVIKTLQAIEAANVVILLLDAQAEISEQDAHIAGFILETGRSLVIGVNKWDHLPEDKRDWIKQELQRKLRFLSFAKVHYISALKAQGITQLLQSVHHAYLAAFAKLSTPKLTRALQDAVAQQPPPKKGAFRPKLRYAHQGGQNPPLIIIHGNALDAIPDSYRRYLESRFRTVFSLEGTPLQISFRGSKNPYADKT